METKETILTNLAHCTGTETYHRFSILFKNLFLTDGAKYLADAAQCYWLMDIIGSYQRTLKTNPFQTWTFDKASGLVKATNGNSGPENILATQFIKYTDFPLDEIKLFIVDNGDGNVIVMLPSEY